MHPITEHKQYALLKLFSQMKIGVWSLDYAPKVMTS